MQIDETDRAALANPASEFEAVAARTLARVKDQRTRIILQMALASLDVDKVSDAQRELDDLAADSALKSSLRLQDIPRQLAAAAPVIAALDLDTSPPLRILGLRHAHANIHFCAKALGHTVTAATLASPVYDRLLAIYGIPQFVQKRITDLPEGQFDLITAGNLAYPTDADWQSFVAKLKERLADGGRIFMTLARRALPERNYDPEAALALFERAGAQVSRKDFSVIMDAAQVQRFCPAGEARPEQGKPWSVRAPAAASVDIDDDLIAEARIAESVAADNEPVIAWPAAGSGPAAAAQSTGSRRPSWQAVTAIVVLLAAVAIAAYLYTAH